VDVGAGSALAECVHARERGRERDVVDPRLDPVGAEVEDDLRVLEGVERDGVATEHGAARRADRLVAERLERDARARAERLGEAVHQRAQAARLELRDERHAAALAGPAGGGEPLADGLERLVPAERREDRAVAALRSRDPIGMVEPLQRGLTADTEAAAVDRVVGIALELHDAAVAIAREHAAAGRALPAHGSEPRGDAGHELLVGNDHRQDRLGRLLAAAGRGRGAGRRHDLEEVASLHGRISRLIARSASARTALSDDT
jgi:hypothetical protein